MQQARDVEAHSWITPNAVTTTALPLCSMMENAVGRTRERRFGVDAHVPE
jgi:hypothetical protein